MNWRVRRFSVSLSVVSLVTLMYLFAFAGTASAVEPWPVLHPENMGFSVKMPKISDPITKESARGTSMMWGSVDNDARYVVSVYKYGDDTKALYDPEFFLDNMIKGFLDKRDGGATKDITVHGVKGREVDFSATAESPIVQRAMFFVTPTSGYIFAVSSSSEKNKTAEEQFFNSIELENQPFTPWMMLDRPDLALSVKIPTSHKLVNFPNEFGDANGWLGIVNGIQYMVMAQKLDKELPPSDFAKTMDGLATGFFSGKDYQLVREFTFQGLPAREYSFREKQNEHVGKALMCVSPKNDYMFVAGGDEGKVENQSADWFASIKLKSAEPAAVTKP